MVHASDFWLVDNNDDENNDAASSKVEDDTNDNNNNNTSMSATTQKIEQETILYQWGTKTAIRRFCRTCGILPFYIPRSNLDGYAITYPCVNWGEDGPPQTEIRSFNGVDWEQSHAATGIAKETTK